MSKRSIAFSCSAARLALLLILSAVMSACGSGFESAPPTSTSIPETPTASPTFTPLPDTPQPTAAPTETAVRPSPTPEGMVAQFECGGSNYHVAYSPDGSLIAASGEKSISICDPETSELQLTINTESRTIGEITWSPDGTRLATGHRDGSVRIWDAASGEQLREFAVSDRQLGNVDWSPDGNWLAITDGSVHIWDVNAGTEPVTIESWDSWEDDFWTVAWSPDSSRIAGGSSYGSAAIWQASTGDLSVILPYLYNLGRSVFSVAWSPDGQRLASALDSLITIYDTTTGQTLLTIIAGPVAEWDLPPDNAITSIQGEVIGGQKVAWSPNGAWLAGVSYHIVQVWDSTTGSEVFYEDIEGDVYGLAWSPDSNQLATTIDRTIVLFDMSGLH